MTNSNGNAPAGISGDPVVLAPLRFDELFDTHFPSLVRLAALVGADDPEDVAQEALFRLHRRYASLHDESAAAAYLRRTVINLSRSRLRHLQVAKRALPRQLVPDAASAEDAAVLRDEHRRVIEAVSRLPARQRAIVVLRYWMDLSPSETAFTLGLPVGTVKSNTFRALRRLALQLEVPT